MHETRRASRRRRAWSRSLRELRDAALTAAAAPLVYSLVLPLALLDAWLWAYQHVCFPAYRVAKVPRGRYFSYDRGRLPYLGPVQRADCALCSYAAGVLAYAREVAARSEQFFCPIKHLRAPESPHSRYAHFADYGDEAAFRRESRRLREALRHPHHEGEA